MIEPSLAYYRDYLIKEGATIAEMTAFLERVLQARIASNGIMATGTATSHQTDLEAHVYLASDHL